ncbi:MAG: nicotinamide-nucleotide amidohydrolase family protein [Clostridiales bacterium]|nr:nicotinamide-nucleotide amidohydrolase family protein [Clostridiales bacterium]
MIKIIAKDYSQAVAYLCDKLESELAQFDLFLSKSKDSTTKYITDSIGAQALIMIGSVGDSCTLFADTFNLPMFYDSFAESKVVAYCDFTKTPLPPRHVMDKLCVAPESFNHYAAVYGYQCTCYGEYKKTHVYMIADDLRECSVVYDNYLSADLFKNNNAAQRYVFKVFGLAKNDVLDRLDKLGKFVSRKCETLNLDTKIVLDFPPKCAKNAITDTLTLFKKLFGDYVYASADQSLAKTVVDLLNSLGKTLSTAESITGGLIASNIVDIAGASTVLKEGVVTYSNSSKSSRLSINPHYIDEHGAVSQQVAQEMARGLRKNGSDIAISTTGFAGPAADDGRVGLCYIGIATEKGLSVYKNVFYGDRNSIRSQAANTALYLVLKTITK